MTPERMKNLRTRIADAKHLGANDNTVAYMMPVTLGELTKLLDKADRYDARTSELLANCNRWEQAYRDVKAAVAAAMTFAEIAAAALRQD